MSSILIISHDVIGQRMAGPGIRMWELARVLARHLPVTLIAPQPIDLPLPANLRCGHYTWGDAASIEPYLRAATNIFANGYVASAHPELLNHPGCLIIDLYDPVALENLELFRNHPLAERQEQAKRDSDLLRALLTRGDHFVCATERQRDLYIGGLLALGRITPAIIDQDPLLHQFIAIVPFGVSDDPPQASGQPALRGVLDDLSTEHTIILWSGGLWDWMEPLTLVRAMPHVLAHVPTARLVFLAGRHPGQVPEMATVQQTRQLAADLGLLGCGVHFYNEWVPYQRRADFLLEAKVMVSLHRAHLETRYAAVRSRILDHFWVGRPSVVSADDAAADLIKEHQAGEVVPIGDSQAVAAVLIRLLTDHQHWTHQSANAAALGQSLRWSEVVHPLLHMLKNEKIENNKTERWQLAMEDRLQTILHERNMLIRELETQWNIVVHSNKAVSLMDRLKQWIQQRLIGSLVSNLGQITDQQRSFNATLVNLIYRLSSSFDEQSRRIDEQLHSLRSDTLLFQQHAAAHLASLTQQLTELKPWLEAVRQEQIALRAEVQTLRTEVQKAYDTLPPLHQHIIDLESRMLDIDEALSQVAYRLSDLPITKK
ncbi:glycosyl transferase family 1 [Chloroflexus sp. MS-CIW-1]|uniref:glycosyltransferase n=1 Tax=Chloroflexus sp. MS-CIW-1 TaxID=3055768 RepID=UPI0026478432|nr:glycosyltransferase [Chloroflexus sp. MS-CIW-1]MDN5273358.1 glycosyl transferase family 1 [Chloroflexus sp. MS-CIW-1]